MTVAAQLIDVAEALAVARADLRAAILAKGVEVPDGTTIRGLAPYIALIPTDADPVDPENNVFPFTFPFALA